MTASLQSATPSRQQLKPLDTFGSGTVDLDFSASKRQADRALEAGALLIEGPTRIGGGSPHLLNIPTLSRRTGCAPSAREGAFGNSDSRMSWRMRNEAGLIENDLIFGEPRETGPG